MSTITIPPALTFPRDDAIQLYRAFKGKIKPNQFILRFYFHCFIYLSSTSNYWIIRGVVHMCCGFE